ncbi:MAG TPA: tetratricopeptide repeat protein [Kiritimatiellia bacterium]|nr:tetratricopeptide repeat protein [Kiritimatiellia bacterium]
MKSTDATGRATVWGRVLFVLSLLLYVFTLSPGFIPGASSSYVASHLGVHPFPPLVNHVWGWMIRLFAAVPVGELAVRVHLFGAICSAASVWLLFQIMMRLRRPRTFEEGMPRAASERVRLFSAIVAALALALAIPFWMAATRAHPLAFDLSLLLLAFHLLLRYSTNGRLSYLYISVLVYAVGLTDFATLVLFLPVYVPMALFHAWRQQHLTWGLFFRLFGLSLVGLAPQFIAALLYMKNDAFVWREFSHYGQVLWYMWRDQYMLVLRSLPRVGWLTVGVVSLVPWVAVFLLGVGRKSASAGAWLGTAILGLLLSVLAGVVLTNTLVSPWVLTRDNPLLITPWVMIAMWAGSMAGYWLALFQRAASGVWNRIGYGFAGVVIAALLAIGVRNFEIASGSVGRWFADYARQVVDRLDDHTVLVSASALDDLVALEAHARGKPLSIINIQAAQQLAYRRYVGSLFDDARYKSLTEVGIQPLLLEWFARETNIASRVIVLDVADLWMAARLQPEPRGLLYRGRAPDQPADVDAIAEDNRAFWRAFAGPLSARHVAPTHPAAPALRHLSAQTAKSANNLGVFWEEAGRADLAVEAYEQARQFDTNNISSLVNLHALFQRENRPEAEALAAQIDALISREQVRRYLWSLSFHHGVIRSPELYASRGWAWAMSGKPALAAANLRQALDLGGDSAALRMALSALDETQDGPDSPEEVLQAELERNPANLSAALGLYRQAVRRGQFSVARGRLEELRRMNAPADLLALEEALLEILTGNTDQAAVLLGEVVRRNPEELRAWAALAVIANERNDAKAVQEALDRLHQARRASPSIRYMAAQVAVRHGDRAGARRQLELVLRQEPRHVPALELMTRLLMAEGDRENAEAFVDRLISADPRHPFGNYLLGAFQTLRGQYALAESSYQASLEARRTPETLNDLAYVLSRLGRHREALELIEECLRTNELRGAAWSTYGQILLALDRFNEAETALQQALANNPESIEVQLYLARVYEKKGQRAEALKLAENILPRSGELLRDDQDGLRDLLKRLR